ncbi:methyltransferase-like protein 27 [Pollicipes pollicipes]|uniref:methyltransferase-like protein 27 n=1 Tax=Pollicipes pollicipes TaxID=41117 RepID=UPI0018852C5F|nr:methyltransferase-like protein 27 [Pollicipes pollicipes]
MTSVVHSQLHQARANGAGPPRLITRLISCQSFEETVSEYNRTANVYDKTFTNDTYHAPRLAAEAVLRMCPADGPVPRSKLRVMDIAAGTGLVAQRLYDAGITHLDGLEPSSEMIALAKARGIYQRLIMDTIGDHKIDVEDDIYDVVVVAGGFVPGHCPVSSLDDMIRICKPGGYVVNTMRLEFLVMSDEYQQLESFMKRQEELGRWRRVERCVIDRYFEDAKQGVTFIYQKL